MKTLSHRTYALIAIALAVVLFLAVNIVSNQWLGTARADLTQNGLYTVSPGTAATLSCSPAGRTTAKPSTPASSASARATGTRRSVRSQEANHSWTGHRR